MALTTTTGFCESRPPTIAAARLMAWASCTEVPPNFMTIIGSLGRADSNGLPRMFKFYCGSFKITDSNFADGSPPRRKVQSGGQTYASLHKAASAARQCANWPSPGWKDKFQESQRSHPLPGRQR